MAPVETLILEGCGHAPQTERPDETLGAVADFVSAVMRHESAQAVGYSARMERSRG